MRPCWLSDGLRSLIGRAFLAYGGFVVRWPWVPVACSLLVAALCAIGVPMNELETDNDVLFYLDTVESWQHKEHTERYYDTNVDSTLLLIEVSANTEFDDAMHEVFALHQRVLAVQGPGGTTVGDRCWRVSPGSPCARTHVFNRLGITNSTGLSAALAAGSVTMALEAAGDVAGSPAAGLGLKLPYLYVGPAASAGDAEWIVEWEGAVNELVQAHRSGLLVAGTLNKQLRADETAKLTTETTPLMALAVVTVVVLVACLLSGRPPVRSRVMVACTSVLSVLLALLCAYGLLGAFGVKSNATMVLMGFVLLGIGVDDIIIIVRQADFVQGPLGERVPKGLQNAGLAITVTSLTSAAAFATATQARLGMARTFCTFGLMAILADYFIQATFFMGLFVYDERRREARRPEVLCCLKTQPGSTGTPSSGRVGRLFRRFGEALITRRGIALSLLTWAVILAAATSQISNITTEFGAGSYYPPSSPLVTSIDIIEKYFEGSDHMLHVHIRHEGAMHRRFFSEAELAVLDGAIEAMVEVPWIEYGNLGRDETDWTFAFRHWLANPGSAWQGRPFNEQLEAFLDAPNFQPANGSVACPPLCIKPYTFRNMVALDGAGFPLWSRIGLHASIPLAGQEAIDRINRAKSIVRERLSSFEGSFVYTKHFLTIERDEEILSVIFTTLGITCLVIVGVLMVFLDFAVAIFSGICIALVDACIIGCMSAIGEPMTIVMFVNLTMVVGMCVDYIVHSAQEILKELRHGTTPEEAVLLTMETMGRCIFEGAASTLLGLLIPGVLAPSAAARNFGRTICLAVLFGLTYGLIWGPTFLYIAALPTWSPLRSRAAKAADERTPAGEPGNNGTDTISL